MMADNNLDNIVNETATPEPVQRNGKKKKKKRGCGFYILALLLLAGVGVGVQATGGYDFRPWLYELTPKIPFVGESLAKFAGIPEIYSLTADQRRKLELDEWEQKIAQEMRLLDEQQKQLDVVSDDLVQKERELEYALQQVTAKLEALSNDVKPDASTLNDAQKAELEEVMRTFNEMSPKNAAAILERLNPTLAVAVLDGLAEDVRARTLGRMDAAMAAGLMEQLAELHRNRR